MASEAPCAAFGSPLRIGDIVVEPPTVLAPMAAITNPPFRQLCLEMGAGLVCSEMLSAEQLIHPRAPVPIERCASERVLVVQLYGRSPVQMARAAQIAVQHGADVVDINMGCPARKVVKQGAGVAIMREPDLAEAIARAVVAAVEVPVTVKLRAGFCASEANADVIARTVARAGVRAVTVHARLREAVHTGPVDWSVIARVRDALPSDVSVIGNGAVRSCADARAMVRSTGADGVMVGGGARGNPWIFESLAAGREVRPDRREMERVVLRHLDLYVAHAGEERAVREMRKHLCWYLKGLPGAARVRSALSRLTTRAAVAELVGRAVSQ